MMTAPKFSPFEYLLAVDRKCVEHQGGLVQQTADTSYSHGLAFNLGPHRYIIPIADIDEVLAISSFTSIPRATGWLKGIANVRGNLVTLLDLHEFLYDTVSKAAERSKCALLVKQEAYFYGLVVDSIIGMKSFHTDKGSDQVPDGFDPKHTDHISAFYLSGEEWYAALAVQNLLLDERFQRLGSKS